MSSDNVSSTVTYTSISSDSNALSWGIPLVNAGELPEMDPYEEVAQQRQVPPLLPAYVPDPIFVLEPEHLEYHAPSDDDIQNICKAWFGDVGNGRPALKPAPANLIQSEDQPYADDASPTAESPGYIADSDSMEEDTDEDSIDYPDEPEDGEKDDDEDPEKDPKEDHSEEHEPEDDDDNDDTDDEDEEPIEDEEEEEHIALADFSIVPVVDPIPSVGDTKAFETDESAPTPRSPQTRVPFSQTRLRRAQKTVRLEPPMSVSKEALIAKHAIIPIQPTSPTYDQAPLGHRAAMIRIRDDIPEEDMPPQRRFVLTAPPPGCDIAKSSAAAARPPRGQYDFVDTVEAGQASEHMMMTSIDEVNLRVSYQAQVRRQENADFHTQLLDARTDRKDIRLEIDVVRGQKTSYETELHESAKDRAIRHMMCTHVLEARAQIDTVEDTGSSSWLIMPVTRQGTNVIMTLESIQAMIDQALQRNSTNTHDDGSQNSGGGPRRPVQTVRVCSYTDFIRCQPLNFKGTKGIVGLSQWLEKMESVFHISGCAINNQVKFATCTLLCTTLTWWNGHVRTLGHDATYTMTWVTLKKKLTDKYCPKGEIKKLEIKLWNLKVKGNDVAAYTQRF
ncbi:hypothetical protein Tco_0523004 [Tanacetum coccineum]